MKNRRIQYLIKWYRYHILICHHSDLLKSHAVARLFKRSELSGGTLIKHYAPHCSFSPTVSVSHTVARLFKKSELSGGTLIKRYTPHCSFSPTVSASHAVARLFKRSELRAEVLGLEFDGVGGEVFLEHKSDLEDDCVIELS